MAEPRALSNMQLTSSTGVTLSNGAVVALLVADLIEGLGKRAEEEGRVIDWRTFELGSAHAREVDGLSEADDYEPDALIVRVQAVAIAAPDDREPGDG
jgi:hypothetical protein